MKPQRPIRVLHVVDGLGMGGAETWLMGLLRLWSRKGDVLIDFMATGGKAQIFDEEARRLGAQIYYVRYRRAHLKEFVTEFRRLLRNRQYRAIHDHQDYVSGWHFLMGAGLLPPVRVAHVHNPWLHIETNYAVSLSRRLATAAGKRLVSRIATDVCGTSGEILQRYGYHQDQARSPRVSVVHCGFDVDRFSSSRQSDRASVLREFGWSEQCQLVLFAGRLDRAMALDHPQNHKNSWLALTAARAAVEKQPSLRLLMAGAGEDSRQELTRRVESWGLEDKLRLIGVRNDIARLMHAADVLFFPSQQEGLGMVAVEAQAAGLPVLASTAVPRECIVIPSLYNALPLASPINLWAEALIEISGRPRASLDICRRAFESSAFSITNSAQRLEELYNGPPR